jgi:hypothetical protein
VTLKDSDAAMNGSNTVSNLVRTYPSIRSEQREGRGKPEEVRGFEPPEGSEERSNEGWRFTDKRGDGIIDG